MSADTTKTGWERVAMAIEEVGERLRRTTQALHSGGVPYAVVGGNAVAEWVGRIDKTAVRFTQDVDILLRRNDLPAAIDAMEQTGFAFRHSASIDFFLDGPESRFRNAVHIVFAGEKIRDHYVLPAADVDESETTNQFRVLNLDALVRMKLTSFRRKDQVHLMDMIDVGLIDASWIGRLISELASRLQQLLDDPDG